MKNQLAVLGVAALSIFFWVQGSAWASVCTVQDSFDGCVLSAIWQPYSEADLALELSAGRLRIHGIARLSRYSYAGVSMVNPIESQSFESTIDLLAVSGTYGGDEHRGRHYTFRAQGDNGHYVELTYWANEYRISWENGQGWQRIYAPSNGDEQTTWYRWKITYDAETQEANVYVNERQIAGTAVVDFGESIQIEIEHAVGYEAIQEGLWDNFRLRYNQIASLEIDPVQLSLEFDGEKSFGDNYYLAGRLVIADESDGLDLLNEGVSIQVGTSEIMIPAGSFLSYGYNYYWMNELIAGSRVKALFIDLGAGQMVFNIRTSNVDLSRTANPVNCAISVGNDSGEVFQRLDGQLRKDN